MYERPLSVALFRRTEPVAARKDSHWLWIPCVSHLTPIAQDLGPGSTAFHKDRLAFDCLRDEHSRVPPKLEPLPPDHQVLSLRDLKHSRTVFGTSKVGQKIAILVECLVAINSALESCQTTTTCQFHWNFHFLWEKKGTCHTVTAQNLQSIKTLLTLELSQHCKNGSMFSSSEQVAASRDCSRLELWVGNTLCLCQSNQASRARELQQELGHWFCLLNLQLHSGTAFGEIARW